MNKKIKVLEKSSITDIMEIARDICNDKGLEEAFYICDTGDIIQKYKEWERSMPRVKPFYAVKCNDDIVVLKTLATLGAGFDCASKNEMKKILGLGVQPSDIIFANPAKISSHIKTAASLNVTTMTFDNEIELDKIKDICPNARLVLRIRCDAKKVQCPLGIKYGAERDDVHKLLTKAKKLDLNVVGVSFHVGSGCMDAPVFRKAIQFSSDVFDVAQTIGYQMTLLDIGGGFPGDTGNTSWREITKIVNSALEDYFPENRGIEVIAEPGRYFVASAFTLLTQVHSIRKLDVYGDLGEPSFMYYINDGVYGSFNCLIYDHAKVKAEPLKKSSYGKRFRCSIWGPTCDGLDRVSENEMMPELHVGDWILFRDMGAYSLVVAGTFNGFNVPRVCYFADEETIGMLFASVDTDSCPRGYANEIKTRGVGCNRDAVGWEADAPDLGALLKVANF